ncbi:magnesium transporter CorA family protein [Paragemmobacter straminiformis]|uniref:Magnesium transporter CorA family protein n=1 Tax=Paragemmobacter straminiformis TaxID=2045119 RepID=A0A842I8N6_9RHOB|nr:magnesium transporter CorA family protein [Gemmobacter straminiformis]MBC2835976.1 magnesium transporter CorA family protein [Gemmobacter straminiformis]
MLSAFLPSAGRLVPLPAGEPLSRAVWIDLFQPTPDEAAAVAALGLDVPTLADMEEIEISNRLYREGAVDCMTVVLTGHSQTNTPISGPVSFILGPDRLVTVRHHASRPFETYPTRADKFALGCTRSHAVFLSLVEEITGRLADLLESAGRSLDTLGNAIHDTPRRSRAQERLEVALRQLGREGHLIGILRLALLTLDRALGFYAQNDRDPAQDNTVKALRRDVNALEVHTDFLSARIAQATDLTLGMINLAQNSTVRIVSVVAVLFSPPMLVASIYGMNFAHMPELPQPWGYPAALLGMVASSAVAWAYFRWKNWL